MPKRQLTPAELKAAAALAEAVTASPLSQEAIAASMGVTQGMIWQWANGRLPVPAHRAVALADAIGVDPSIISVAYRAFINGAAPWLSRKMQKASSTSSSPDDSLVSPALTPKQQALLGLFDGLTESQQRELLRSAEAKKQENDAVIEELVKGRKQSI